MTSHDVVAVIRRLFGTRAVGHTGTLDPFATGLLVIVMGRATRLARFIDADRKRYRAVARLGVATDSDDLSGAPIGEPWEGPWPGADEVAAALAAEVGHRPQMPPAFSAKQVGGRRSHAAARRGETLELAPAMVTVHDVTLIDYAAPHVEWETTTGPGTYVRAMARDVGRRLGTGAHLTALRREAIGSFDVEAAVPLDRLTGMEPLVTPAALVDSLPPVVLTVEEAAGVRQGRRVGAARADAAGFAALLENGALVAVGEPRDGRWQPVAVVG